MRWLYNLIFTSISLLLLVTIYLINQQVSIGSITNGGIFNDCPNWLSYTTYFAFCLLITWASALLFPKFPKSDIKFTNIQSIESADGVFIPTYLAYIFIGLSVDGSMELLFCYGILIAICFTVQIYLFNPAFYLLGYRFSLLQIQENKNITYDQKTHTSIGNA